MSSLLDVASWFDEFLESILVSPAYKTTVPLAAFAKHLASHWTSVHASDVAWICRFLQPHVKMSFGVKDLLKLFKRMDTQFTPRSLVQSCVTDETLMEEILDGLVTSLDKSDIRKLSTLLKPHRILPTTEVLFSSGTQSLTSDDGEEIQAKAASPVKAKKVKKLVKKKSSDICTSSIPVHLEHPTAGASSFLAESSSDDMDVELLSHVTSQKSTSSTGCSIFYKTPEESFTLKSERFPTWTKLIKFDIYDDPKAWKKTPAMTRWKKASFRSTLLVEDKETLKLIKQLKTKVIENGLKFPGLVSDRRPLYGNE